jgi:hypothetical protein
MANRELSQALCELRARVILRLLGNNVEISEAAITEALQRASDTDVYDSFNRLPQPHGRFALLRRVLFWR